MVLLVDSALVEDSEPSEFSFSPLPGLWLGGRGGPCSEEENLRACWSELFSLVSVAEGASAGSTSILTLALFAQL